MCLFDLYISVAFGEVFWYEQISFAETHPLNWVGSIVMDDKVLSYIMKFNYKEVGFLIKRKSKDSCYGF